MENSKNKTIVTVAAILGIIFALIDMVLSIVNSSNLLLRYFDFWGASVTSIIVSVLMFVTFILGICGIFGNPNCALAAAIISAISSVALSCWIGLPHRDAGRCAINVLTAVFAFLVFLLFAFYYVNVPSGKKQVKLDRLDLLNYEIYNELYELRAKLANGSISEEEYARKESKLFSLEKSNMQQIEATAQKPDVKRKNALLLFIIPSVLMIVTCAAAIPSVYVKACEHAYNGLRESMTEMNCYLFSHNDFYKYDYRLPESYKDVAEIHKEYRDYNVRECVELLEHERGSAEQSRLAYLRLAELQELDSRWNFDSVINCSGIIKNTRWEGEDYYFYCGERNNNGGWFLDTNLPNIDTKYDISRLHVDVDGKTDSIVIAYDSSMLSLVHTHVAFRISNFTYDEENGIYSMEIRCYADWSKYTLTYREVERYEWDDFEWSI